MFASGAVCAAKPRWPNDLSAHATAALAASWLALRRLSHSTRRAHELARLLFPRPATAATAITITIAIS